MVLHRRVYEAMATKAQAIGVEYRGVDAVGESDVVVGERPRGREVKDEVEIATTVAQYLVILMDIAQGEVGL